MIAQQRKINGAKVYGYGGIIIFLIFIKYRNQTLP